MANSWPPKQPPKPGSSRKVLLSVILTNYLQQLHYVVLKKLLSQPNCKLKIQSVIKSWNTKCRWKFEDSYLFFHERLPTFDRHVARRRNRFVHGTLQGHERWLFANVVSILTELVLGHLRSPGTSTTTTSNRVVRPRHQRTSQHRWQPRFTHYEPWSRKAAYGWSMIQRTVFEQCEVKIGLIRHIIRKFKGQQAA